VPVERVKEYQLKLTDFLTTNKAELLARIGKEKAVSDPLKDALKVAAEEFQQGWK
jgi:F-type H+-transporting ATPase subunit alpha